MEPVAGDGNRPLQRWSGDVCASVAGSTTWLAPTRRTADARPFKVVDTHRPNVTKLERLDDYLDDRDLDAVWFGRPNSFAWLTGGNNVVDRAGDVGVAAAGYDGDGLEVVTTNIEADRLRDEELPDDIPVTEFDWYETSLAEAVADHSPEPAGADFDVPGFESVDASPLRQPLTEEDVETYRELGRETARALEAVCRELQPGDVESEVASALRVALSARNIEVPVALVGGAERARTYRHYTPTDAQLGGYALVSVTAERDGLHASATRTVAFDARLSEAELNELRERHQAARVVEATALGATRAVADRSGGAADVFSAIQTAYERVGHPDEWRQHHQGGAAGYAGREWIATPDVEAAVTTPMAYAWNPTVQGAKSEDTVLVTGSVSGDGSADLQTESGGGDQRQPGFEMLTATGDWPTTAVTARDYDVTLERPDVLVMDGS